MPKYDRLLCHPYDPEMYESFLKTSYLKKIILEGIEVNINDIVQEITDRGTIKFDLFDLASKGYSSLPVTRLCFTSREQEIRQQALSYFISS